jgi:hypothetical protein
VINADPFFLPEQKVSEPALEALEGRPALIWRLMQKMMFQRVHRILCAAVPFVCQESEPAIFRSARDGQWNWIGPYVAERSNPIDRAAQKKIAREELQKAKHWGEHFLTEVGLNRRCVVLTGTPSPTYDSIEFAESLARALKTSSIFPPLDGMATVDASHLNLASAERWSGQFLEALRPILQDCLPQ